jgi:hypothetical protein
MLRGTVFILTEHNDTIGVRRRVLSMPVTTAVEFRQQAEVAVRGDRLPGHEPTRIEFGPIGEPWRRL